MARAGGSPGSRSAATSSSWTTRTAPACPPGRRCDACRRTSGRAPSRPNRWPRGRPSWRPARSPISCWRSLIFALTFTFVGVHVTAPRVDELVAGRGRRRGRLQAGRRHRQHRRPADRDVRRHATHRQRQRRPRAHLRGRSRRRACSTLKATPARREISDRFGNKLRVGVIGIKPQRHPAGMAIQALRADRGAGSGRSRKPSSSSRARCPTCTTWSWAGNPATSCGGPLRIAEISGQVASLGFVRAAQPHGRAFGEHRPDQPVSDPAARWRSPFVLCDRGGPAASPLSERAQEIGFRIGLAMVLMLMVFTTYQDRLIPLRWMGIG